jgi:AraC-like DNA-binding protein/quercetin dioxygenase-like cupin family protein
MIDEGQRLMHDGAHIAAAQADGVNDNMHANHAHEYFELYYLESGQRHHLIGREVQTLNPGQFLIFRPGQMHHSYGDRDMPFSRLLLYFEPNAVPGRLANAVYRMQGPLQLPADSDAVLHRLLRSALNEQQTQNPFAEEAIKALTDQVLVLLARKQPGRIQPPTNPIVASALSYIDEHFAEPLSVAELAARHFVSEAHLCRLFTAQLGISPGTAIRRVRLTNARRLLAEDKFKIGDIAKRCGFDSATDFGRVFRKAFNMTPSDYLKSLNR